MRTCLFLATNKDFVLIISSDSEPNFERIFLTGTTEHVTFLSFNLKTATLWVFSFSSQCQTPDLCDITETHKSHTATCFPPIKKKKKKKNLRGRPHSVKTTTATLHCSGEFHLPVQTKTVCPGWQLEAVFAVHSGYIFSVQMLAPWQDVADVRVLMLPTHQKTLKRLRKDSERLSAHI